MSDTQLLRTILTQPETHTLYSSDGNYSLEIPVPQPFMTVSSTASAGEVQVLANPASVTFLSPDQVSVTEIGHYVPPSSEPVTTTELTNVQDLFPRSSASCLVSPSKVITISVHQAPAQNAAPSTDAGVYSTLSASGPKASKSSNSQATVSKGEKQANREEKPVYACEYCQATFRRASNLKIHIQRHLGIKPFACDQCSAAFVEEKNLKRHMVAHRTDRPHVCHECGLAFVESGNLTRHMLTHSGSKDFVCDTCGAAFSKSHHLKDHLANHIEGGKQVIRNYECEECHNVFNNPFQLRKHIKSAHSEGSGRPYVCGQCGAVFGWWNIFRRHLLTHRGQKPFVCEKCNEGFTDNLALRQHKRTHARDKTNRCPICDAAFDRPSHLVRHVRVHTGEKPNVCSECGAAFLERNKLVRHMRIHNGATGAVVCELCGARFTQVRHFTHHMKSHGDSSSSSFSQIKKKTSEDADSSRPNSRKKGKTKENDTADLSLKKQNRRSGRGKVAKRISSSVSKDIVNSAEKIEKDMCVTSTKRDNMQDAEEGCQRKSSNSKFVGMTTRKRAAELKNQTETDMSESFPSRQTGGKKSDTEAQPPRDKKPKAHKRSVNGVTANKTKSRQGQRFHRGKTKKKDKTGLCHKETITGEETDEYEIGDEEENSEYVKPESPSSVNESNKDIRTKPETSVISDDSGAAYLANNSSLSNDKNGISIEEKTMLDKGKEECVVLTKTQSPAVEAAKEEVDAGEWMVVGEVTAVGDGKLDDSRESASDDSPSQFECAQDSMKEERTELTSGPDPAVNVFSLSRTAQSDTAVTEEGPPPPAHHDLHTISTTAQQNSQLTQPAPAAMQPVELVQYGVSQQERENSGFVLFGCKQCSAVFNSAFSLKLHKRVHKTRVAVCLRCGDLFSSSTDLAHHREVCVGFLPFQSIPDVPATQLSQSSHSDKSPKGKRHGCHLCGASFAHLNKLKLHMQFHTDSRKFVCNECGASFGKSTDLRAHIRTHTGDRPFVCNICGASYTQSSTLSVHMKTHSGQKPHVCEVCGAAFPRHGRLKVHMRCHSGDKPCVCKLCGAAFKWSQTLLRHMNQQHSSAPYSCKQCEETFHQEKLYKAHLQIHSGERPHSCPQCKKAFKLQVQLRRHSRVHTGDWPFLCEECGAGFGSAASLKIHMRCHTGEKPFVCEECGRAFRISSHLTRHMNSHTDDPIFVKRKSNSRDAAALPV